MAASVPMTELDTRFSSEMATAAPWPDVVAAMKHAEIFWLSTVRRDGRPHVTPLPAMWLDDALHFCTGPEEQKARNLARNDHCILTTGTDRFRSGLDIVVEGRAVRVTDHDLLVRLAALWLAKLDWAFDVVDGGFRDPGREDAAPNAHVFRVAPSKVLTFGKGEPFSQTRYRFPTDDDGTRPDADTALVVSLPTHDRKRGYDFYRTALGLETIGELADDGVPEPLQFVVNDGVRVMFIPTGGFGWVVGGRPLAADDQSECLLALTRDTDDDVAALLDAAAAAGATIVTPAGPQPWGFAGAFADPDGHVWMVRTAGAPPFD